MTAVHAIRPFRLERISQNNIWTYCHKSIYPEAHRGRPYLTWMGLQRSVPIGFRTPPGKISRCRVASPRCPQALRLPRSTACHGDHPSRSPVLAKAVSTTQTPRKNTPSQPTQANPSPASSSCASCMPDSNASLPIETPAWI